MLTFEVRIVNGSADPKFENDTHPLPSELDSWLRKHVSGSCVGQGVSALFILEIQAPNQECFAPLINAYCASFAWGRNVSVVILEKTGSSLTPELAASARAMLVQSAKLTKAFFLSLPPGTFVASNVYAGKTPVFADYVSNATERLAQWENIVVCRAAQRLCYTFPSREAFAKWEAEKWEGMRNV